MSLDANRLRPTSVTPASVGAAPSGGLAATTVSTATTGASVARTVAGSESVTITPPSAPGLALRAPTESDKGTAVDGTTKAGLLALAGMNLGPGRGVCLGGFMAPMVMYADIAAGRTHLKVTDPAAMKDIAKLLQTPSGRDLLQKVAYESRHDITLSSLTPIEGQDLAQVASNAVTEPRGGPAGAKFDPKVGTASEVYYLPGQTADDGKGHPWSTSPSDAVLFHELVHAYHMDRGTIPKAYVEDQSGKLPESEYQATGLGTYRKDPGPNENDYRKERREKLGEALPDRETYR